MDEAKSICTSICTDFGVEVFFDNKWKNYLPGEYNKSACSDSIDCAFYQDWNYDLLVFAVLHELGHIVGWKNVISSASSQQLDTRIHFPSLK